MLAVALMRPEEHNLTFLLTHSQREHENTSHISQTFPFMMLMLLYKCLNTGETVFM